MAKKLLILTFVALNNYSFVAFLTLNSIVTALDWSADGNLLASASYDGSLKLWSRAGVLHVEVTGCTGPPICAAKFNKKTDALLTASFAGAVHVWAVPSGHLRHSYEALHSGQSLDVDWRNNTSFASCGSDGLIHVCKLGDIIPFHTFTGHKVAYCTCNLYMFGYNTFVDETNSVV
jgi:transducin (beta)-like 1